MKRKLYTKVLSLFMAVVLFTGLAFPATASAEGETGEAAISDYETFLEEYSYLELFAEFYADDNADLNEDPVELALNFIRTGVEKYNDDDWETLAGAEKKEFVEYVIEQDEVYGTNVMGLRNLSSFELPSGELLEVEHLFAAMNLAYYAKIHKSETIASQSADFGSWAGDLIDLLLKSKDVTGADVNEIAEIIYNDYLGKDLGDNSFDQEDINSDLDAFYILNTFYETDEYISTIMENYYTEELSAADRADYFLKNRLGGVESRLDIRDAVWKAYSENTLVQVLEATRGLDTYTDQKTACSYAFGDYLFYLAGDGNDSLTPPEDVVVPEEPEEDDKDDVLTENSLYEVFSSKTTTLAPGVTQTIKYATTADDKQIVYYIAKADINRDDVSVHANYNNHDGSKIALSSVRSQLLAAQEVHSNPNSEKYVENYNAIVATNGDFFNMNTGRPSGALVMEGVEYYDAQSENFFAILKDGRAVLGTKDEWSNYKGQVQEAIGGSITLVKDGEIAVTASSNYYNTRASRTCVGVTANNEVVLMVLDGRQEPFSAGGSAEEIAQIMYDAGCVNAMNLDGGGSTTFIAKQEGEDEVSVVNNPSDGYERKVSSSLMIVSTAKVSNEFDHATIDAENTYAAIGASIDLTATGVSGSGNSAELPADAAWTVEDETIGTITENGVFTALANGEAVVNLKSGETVIGTITIHVVEPDKIEFTEKEVSAIYGQTVTMPIKASYKGNEVAINLDSEIITFAVADTTAGTFSGGNFTAATEEESTARSTPVTATLTSNEKVTASSVIYFYREGEATFDFNNATEGDRTLAWHRVVSNTTTGDNYVYELVNPDEEVQIDYSFAVDLNNLTIPKNIEDALPVLAAFMGDSGADVDEDATAWELLMSLAERISPSTTVTVTMQLAEGLEADLSEILVNCEYFDLTSVDYDKETGKITLVCNWIKVYGPIDASTSNSVCIVSGIKLNVKEDAELDENDQLVVVNEGSIDYMARLRSTQAYSIAGSSLGASYGLSPYDNTANLENDRGAEFSSNHAKFEDSYVLDLTSHEGWVTTEEGSQFYYVKNQKLTGIQCVPNPDGTEELYYDFGTDGVCIGKYTGFFEKDGGLAYCVSGVLRTGWRVVDGNYYYFDHKTYLAVDGVQNIHGFTYTFENKILVKGCFYEASGGTRYYWAGTYLKNTWINVERDYYYVDYQGYLLKGFGRCYAIDESVYGTHVFDEKTGVFQIDLNGRYDYKDGTYWVEDGFVNPYPGLVKDSTGYYYFNSSSKAVKNCTYFITKTNGLLEQGTYKFDEEGKMINPPVDPSSKPDVEKLKVTNNVDVWVDKEENLYTGQGKIAIVAIERENYYGKENEQPVIKGYLFAGWFEDQSCEKVFTGTKGTAYAKFVDEKVLSVKAQTSAGIKTSDAGKLRIISSVDSANYANVGFSISINHGTVREVELTKVYNKFYAVKQDGTRTYYTPDMISTISEHFVAYTINNIPQSVHDSEFSITPYWTTMDGTRVVGTEHIRVISQMPGYEN